MNVIVAWLSARLKEASTYSGLAALLLSFHVVVPESVLGILPTIGAAIAAVLAVVIPSAPPAEK